MSFISFFISTGNYLTTRCIPFPFYNTVIRSISDIDCLIIINIQSPWVWELIVSIALSISSNYSETILLPSSIWMNVNCWGSNWYYYLKSLLAPSTQDWKVKNKIAIWLKIFFFECLGTSDIIIWFCFTLELLITNKHQHYHYHRALQLVVTQHRSYQWLNQFHWCR